MTVFLDLDGASTSPRTNWRCSVAEAGGFPDLDILLNIEPGRSGRKEWGRLQNIVVTYQSKKGRQFRKRIGPEYRIRKALCLGFLPSAAIVIDLTKNYRGHIKTATFRGAGWGHGVGLCQIGGLGRALLGQSYAQILTAYYDQVRLRQIYK